MTRAIRIRNGQRAGKSYLGATAIVAMLMLTGCEEGKGLFAGGGGTEDADGTAPVARSATSTRLIERDIEAPQVFQATDKALWDGRPSLGGVWVASPDAVDPERVIIRNPANGKFVIGALFRRERLNPGPTLQISSDAAGALDILAGQPATLSVTALRREEVADEPPATATAPILDAAETVETTTLAATATAAIDRADTAKPAIPVAAPAAIAAATVASAAPAPTPAAARAPVAPKPQTAKPASAPAGRSLVQIGIFSVEANAGRASAALTKADVPTRILKEESQGKTFWRVVAGPAPAAMTRDQMLAKVKSAGFGDAYFVSR
ncbi:MAG: SPOR domain-containing protein [Paracoccaceae bacterium]|nr:MAG: SPOR domain-containing protein [Paracoccaceae bacterium]